MGHLILAFTPTRVMEFAIVIEYQREPVHHQETDRMTVALAHLR